MGYVAWSVVFGEQPSAAKWNILGQNDAAFNADKGVTSEGLQSTCAFLARRTTDQAGIVTGTPTKIQFATEVMDRGNDFDAVTNYAFVAPYTGDYHVEAAVHIDAPGTGGQSIAIMNGATAIAFKFDYSPAAANDNSSVVSITTSLSAGDSITVNATHNAGANRTFIGSLAGGCFFSGYLIGRP